MAKNGKKSFLDYFKINDSSDEYEDDLFDDDEYDDDEDDFDEEYEPKPKAVNGRSSASTYTDIKPSKDSRDAAALNSWFPPRIFTMVVSYTAGAMRLAAKRFQIS